MITHLRSLDVGQLFLLAGVLGLVLLALGYGGLALLVRFGVGK